MQYLDEYKKAIADGTAQPIGQWMQKNFEYVENGLKEGRFFYDHKKAKLKIEYIQHFCPHVKGFSGVVKLEPWQKYLIACIFGLVDAEGKRQFTEFPVVIARKQGKSYLSACLENAVLFTEPEPGMEIYNIAPRLKQANIIYETLCCQIDKVDSLRKKVKKRRSDIYYIDRNSYAEPIAFAHKTSDGFNPYCVIYDEFAAWAGEASLKMYGVMQSAGGARINNPPIHFACSTANYIDEGLYDYLMKRSTAVLNGTSSEKKLLPFIYMIDDPTKWDDLDEIRKAMPNLGVSCDVQFVKDELVKAKANNTDYLEFMTKLCNIKQNSSSAWLTASDVKKTACKRLDPEMFEGCFGVGGIDLSQTTDLTAASIVIQIDGIDYALTQFFMPYQSLKRLSDIEHFPYQKFADLGFLTVSGDHHVDYHDVVNWFDRMRTEYKINCCVVGYDRYSAQYLVDEMSKKGYLMDDVIQGTNLTPIIDEFGGRLKDGLFKAGTNGLLQAHLKNVALKKAANDNRVRPEKIDQQKHIDGFVSVIDALTVRQKHFEKFRYRLINKGKKVEDAVLKLEETIV